MRPTVSPNVQRALHAEMAPMVLDRIRAVLVLGIVSSVLSMVADFATSHSDLTKIVLVKIVGICLYAVGAIILTVERGQGWERTLKVAVPAASLLALVPGGISIALRDPLLAASILVIVTLGGAIVFPWGLRPQLALISMATFSFTASLVVNAAMTPNLVVVVLAGFVAAAYAAETMERQRLERKAVDLHQLAQRHVLERIAEDASIDQVAAAILACIAEQWPTVRGTLLLFDDTGRHMRVMGSINLPADYVGALDGLPCDPSDPAWGHRRFQAAAEITADGLAERGPDWARVVGLAQSHGLGACWSEPVRSPGGAVLGTLALYEAAARDPEARELALVDEAIGLTSIALDRDRSRRQLARYVEELAKARDEALASTRAKSEFLANMSHEIRTPMNGVIGMTDILLDTPLTEEQKDYAHTIRRCSDSLLTVINDILDFSKIEAGKMTIERVDLDLRVLVEEVADLLAPRANEKNVELTAVIPPDFPGRLQGDPSRLRQVLTNLVGNAIKFTDRGEVTITVRPTEDTADTVGFELSVRDTGIGIAPERQAEIFESFTQVDGSSTRRHGGTGLGLTISRQLVTLMGGTIGVDSLPGRGSVFWVRLDLPRQTGASEVPRTPPAKLRGARILVVDDNATNRLILREQLRAWGSRTMEVASGDEAIAMLRAAVDDDPFHLVILDMQMPEMDGQTTARLIRRNPRLAGTPLVLLSSIGVVRGGMEAIRAMGFDAGLSKPVRQSQLCDVLADVLTGRAEEAAIVRTAGAPISPDAPLRALIVEDNPVNQKVAQRMLETLGCQCDSVPNGLEALEALGRTFYDIVIMDVQMPVMDGVAATKEIRRREDGGTRIPIVAMTAHAMQGDRERCLAAGMDDYIPKPVSRDAFRNALARCGAAIAARRKVAPEAESAGAQTLQEAQAALERARLELERVRARVEGRASEPSHD